MQKISQLKAQAIKAAKQLDWPKAIEINQAIIKQDPNDLEALNRLGQAYLQQNSENDLELAKKCFSEVLKVNKHNKIASKNLDKIKKNTFNNINCFTFQEFIDEPGKSKTIALHRLAGKQVLQQLSIGQNCQLVPKSRFISIETDDHIYIGALPEDVSCRLAKLIKNGNTYCCTITSCCEKTCSVHIKELVRAKKNQDINSFPISKNLNSININDEIVLEDDIPVDMLSADDEASDSSDNRSSDHYKSL